MVTSGAGEAANGLIVGLGFALGLDVATGLALGCGVAQLALANVLSTRLFAADGDGQGEAEGSGDTWALATAPAASINALATTTFLANFVFMIRAFPDPLVC